MSRPAIDGGGEPDIARVASAFADPRRVRVLIALADGRALPAGRLAEEAGVSASTASNHLAILLERGLVASVHSDDPAYFGGYIGDNYVGAAGDLGLDVETVARIARNGFVGSFLDDATRHAHVEAIDALCADAMERRRRQ